MSEDQDMEIGGGQARDLARRALAGTDRAAARPEPADLAAWLDGTLSEAEAATVERWLARAPDAAAEAALLREDLRYQDTVSAAAAPERFVARAQSIVHAPAPAGFRRPAGVFGWLSGQPALRWGAVATVAVVIGFGGFEMGNRGLAASLQAEETQTVELPLDFGEPPSPFM
jgi:anti-sigma factor RsiW